MAQRYYHGKPKPRKPKRCDGGHRMVWAYDEDKVCRNAACRDCGQSWELTLVTDARGKVVMGESGWRLVFG